MVLTKPQTVDAAKAWKAPNARLISDAPTMKIGSKHTFIPEFTKDTVLTVSHPGDFENSDYDSSATFKTLSVDALNSTKRSRLLNGNYSARYSKVGYYNGQQIDLIIRITGGSVWGSTNTAHRRTAADGQQYGALGHVAFPKDRIGLVAQGFNHVDVEWKTVKSGTNTAVSTAGYYTFNDIDYNQFISFPNETYNKFQNVLVENESNRLTYEHVDKNNQSTSNHSEKVQHRFSYYAEEDVNDGIYDHRHAITVVYNETSTLNFRWGGSYWYRGWGSTRAPYLLRNANGVAITTGDLMMYTTHKPTQTAVPSPTKTQNVADNATLTHDQTVKYTIKQEVPNEYSKFWWKSFEIRDQVDPTYDVDKSTIKVRSINSNKDITSDFTISLSDSNLITVKAKDPYRASFYGDTYEVTFSAKLNGNKVLNNIGSSNTYNITNSARTIVDGNGYNSGTVRARTTKHKLIVKHVDENGKNIVDPVTTSYIRGMPFSASPRTDLKTSEGRAYRHWYTSSNPTGSTSGTMTGDRTITFHYEEPREVTVYHRTNDSNYTNHNGDYIPNRLLGTEVVWEYPEESITVYSKKNHYSDDEGYYFRPQRDSGTITVSRGSETSYTFYYDTPRTITIRHYDKDDLKQLSETYVKGIYDGQTYTANPLTSLIDVDGYPYRDLRDPSVAMNYNSNWNYSRRQVVYRDMLTNILYERPRIIEILHIDDDSDDVIRTNIHHKRIYDGDGYEIWSYADEELKYRHNANNTDYFYYPLNKVPGYNKAVLKGTVIERNVDKTRNTYTLSFRYTKPSLDLGLTYIRIDTERASVDQPVKLEFEHQIIVPERWADNTVNLTIYDRENNMIVYEETDLAVDTINDGYEIKVDSTHRRKGSKAVYEAVLRTNDKEKLVSGYATSATIDTNSYAASERILKGESIPEVNTTVAYEGVAMTERKLGEDIQEHMERVVATIEPDVNMISGYGYEFAPVIKFETEVDYHGLPEIIGNVNAHPNIADGDYDVEDGQHTFDLDSLNKDVDLTRETTLRMPNVYVNRKDGKIFREDADGRVDGGRKVYVPIWVNKLGDYIYNVESSRMGRNYVKYDIDQNVTLDAYMFGHIDSDTLNDDALLIEPAKTSMLDKFFKGR